MKSSCLSIIISFLFIKVNAQVPLADIVEDKQQTADACYGTFTYQGKPYTGNAIDYH